MDFEEFKKKMLSKLACINIQLPESKIRQFYSYAKELIEWNEKINLTAIVEMDEVIDKHFVDSLTISQYISEKDRVIDVGTGAGFPGIPLKIQKEKLNIDLLDSLNKRINFLNEVIKELQLENITTIHSRAEDESSKKEKRESYDIAVSRAVANLPVLLEYLLPFVRVGGACICMKGANIENELSSSKKALKELGGEIEEIKSFELPETDAKRNIIIVRKVAHTPNKYPRKAGTASKNPIV